MKIIQIIGQYTSFLFRVLTKPQKNKIFFANLMREIYNLGVNSVGIVLIISFFMGAVISLQTGYTFDNSFYPKYLIAFATRKSMILEFSSTIVSLILAGKVGSKIASEIGTMRITEQIDALDTMGVNSYNYLVLPKIVAALLFNPILFVLSVFTGIGGGWLASIIARLCSSEQFAYGIRFAFNVYYIEYSLIKMLVFAFIITSISSFYGYYVSGGAINVGRASTKAVVNSSILILLFNLLLTHLLLK